MPLTPSGLNASHHSSQSDRTFECPHRHSRSTTAGLEAQLGAAAESSGDRCRLRESVVDLAGDGYDRKTRGGLVGDGNVDGTTVAVEVERTAAIECSGKPDVSGHGFDLGSLEPPAVDLHRATDGGKDGVGACPAERDQSGR